MSTNPRWLLLGILTIIFLIRLNLSSPYTKETQPDILNSGSNIQRLLSDKIDELLPQPQSALLSGILLGVKSNLSPELNRALRNTSTIHIVVVSGQNLSLVAGFIFALVSFLGRRKTIVISSIVVLFYAYLTGFQIPVMRALLMVELAFLAQLLGKEGDSTWILVLTALLMLIFSPQWLFSISFQLSFLATAATLVISPIIAGRIKFIPDLIRQDLAVSLAVQILTWPVIAANFNQLSLVGVLANVFILWTVAPIMITGMAALILGVFFLELGKIAAFVPGVLLTYFVYIVDFFNRLPLSNFTVSKTSPLIFIGYYLLVISLYLRAKNVTIDK